MSKILFILIFFINFFTLGQTINIIYPKNNNIVPDTIINFKWESTIDVEYYQIQIAKDSLFNNIIKSYNTVTPNKKDTLAYDNYYWRARYYYNNNFSNWAIDSFIVFSPNKLSSTIAWYSIDFGIIKDSLNRISIWKDKSNNNNNLIQNDTLYQPIFKKSNITNDSVVSFDGETQALKTSPFTLEQPYSIFILFNNNNISYNQYIFDGNNVNTGRFSVYISNTITLYSGDFFNSPPNIIVPNYNLTTLIFNNSNSIIRNNLTEIGTGNPGTNNPNGFTLGTYGIIGSNPSTHAKIDCNEIIICDTILDSLDIHYIEKYLIDKYAPNVNLGHKQIKLYGFCDTTLDAGSRFTNYLWSTGDTTQTITVNQAGQYSVTVTDIFGFQSSDSVMVYYPQINQQLSDTIICFGDTIKWNAGLQDTNYTFLWQDNTNDSIMSIFSAGQYYVQITDSFGCSFKSDTIHITIDNYPVTTSLGNDTSLCAGQNLYLQTGANETSNYLWNTGDTTAYLQINSAGEYSVTTTNTIGCVAIDTINIAIHGYAPIPGFDFSNTCFNDTTTFIDTSYTTDGSNIISWQWNFGNTETSTLQNPNILFADTGIYNVSLTVLTDSNCTNQINKQIEINPLPSAGFTHDALCQNYNINFINTSEIPKGSIDSVIWNINGNTLNSYNAIYNFPEYGNKQIKLKVFSDKNCKDSITKNIEIKPSPIAGFSVNNACVNKFVRFQNQTQTLSYNAILETLWNLDNFQTSVENPVYQFGMNDTSVNVQLYVKTVNGCTDTLRRQIHLYNNPVAKINNDSVCVLNPITLSESSSIENDSINYYLWEINGNFIESKNPNYTFTQTGSNTVTLFVNTIHNCSDTAQKNIEILDLPNADFTISPEYGIVNTTTHIVPETSNYSHIWNINNTTYTDSILNISFSDTGTTIIKHTAINNFGCKDSSSTKYLLVSPYADIAILNLSTKISGNKLTAEADIINFGNILIDSILISIHPEGYSTVSEKWTGRLIPKDYFHYRFNTIYNLTNTPEYICVSIKSLGIFPDPDITNNTTCNQSSDEFKVFPVYPNPASESINISFTIPEKDNVEISIYNSKGKLVKKYPINNLDNKFNIVNINTSGLEKSVYTITLKYKKDTKSLKFVKN